jgi:hypothetical protein
MLEFNVDVISEILKGMFDKVPQEKNIEFNMPSSRKLWAISNPKLTNSYLEDSNAPMLSRAMWMTRRDVIQRQIGGSNFYCGVDRDTWYLYMAGETVNAHQIRDAIKIAEAYNRPVSVSAQTFKFARANVLSLQSRATAKADEERRKVSTDNFLKYWKTIKDAKRQATPNLNSLLAEWATIPLQPNGVESSRTWGIEVETVRANQTSKPRGWESVYDGSLNNNTGGGCECGCDDCDSGYHCEYDDCSGGETDGAREFVSPILKHVNSTGLKQLCTDLGAVESDSTPGIHVHVGADDLSVSDIARLLFAYGVVAPFIQPLYYRKTTDYCKETRGENVTHWLKAVREAQRNGTVVRLSDVAYSQPCDRYYDVNLESINKHGTVEFRAMGPRYDYNHLMRWTWFVREMANVSKLGLPQSTWTDCKSLTDVIKVLRTYGTEIPLNKPELVSASTTTADEQ